ncbi:MFS transporter [Amycolatopsis sp. NPDC059090]|uniref:MFS transporter n=1 Tax=unclassified Amycolatopsis TaxID=2618356 RepID=UPI0036725580
MVFAVVASAVGMSNLDLFVVNVALPAIGHDFRNSSLGTLSWVLNGYAIAFAALLVPFGRVADRLGHRSGFLLGIVVFTGASALCALCPSVGWLIGARVLQAAGAALLVPTSLALLLAATPPERRQPMVRAWTAVGGAAAALGPLLGGVLTQADWRWIFLINVPVGVVCLTAGLRVLPKTESKEGGPKPDLVGAALLTLAVGALALALVKVGDWGWGSAAFLISAAVTVAAVVLLVLQSNRHPAPVIETSLLRVRGFAAPTVAATLFTVAFAMMLLSIVLWCQQVLGYSSMLTGFAVAPGPLMVPILAFAVTPLAKRLGGTVKVAVLGIVAFAAGIVCWTLWADPVEPQYFAQVLPGMMLTGVGVGLTLPALIGTAATVLPANRFATGSAIIQMARQVGTVLGIAVLVSVLGGNSSLDAAALPRFRTGWVVVIAVCVLAGAAALTRPAAKPAVAEPAPEPEPKASADPSDAR